MTNFIITIASAIFVFIVQLGLNLNSLPLAILLPLGFYGTIASAKLYERGELHINIANQWRKKIDELCPDAQLILYSRVHSSESTTFWV